MVKIHYYIAVRFNDTGVSSLRMAIGPKQCMGNLKVKHTHMRVVYRNVHLLVFLELGNQLTNARNEQYEINAMCLDFPLACAYWQ
jgi:hypothetical protein